MHLICQRDTLIFAVLYFFFELHKLLVSSFLKLNYDYNLFTVKTNHCCTWEKIGTNPGNAVYAHCSVQYDEDHLAIIGKIKYHVNCVKVNVEKNLGYLLVCISKKIYALF